MDVSKTVKISDEIATRGYGKVYGGEILDNKAQTPTLAVFKVIDCTNSKEDYIKRELKT